MRPFLTIIDDFLQRPDLIRNEAIAAGFKDVDFKGTIFQNTGVEYKPSDPIESLTAIFGRVKIFQSAFRLGTVGTVMNSYVHADDIHAQFAGVLYLNLPENTRGGTAFWRHMVTGLERMPNKTQRETSGIPTEEEWREEWKDKSAWEMHTLAGAAFNRFIYYPTDYFHSRYPFEGFGFTPENGRLVWIVFFDVP